MFAKNILIEVMKCMKMDLKDMKGHAQKLLKERSTYGDSPLHAALRYGQRDIIKCLLMLISINKDSKTLVNGQNSSGKVQAFLNILTFLLNTKFSCNLKDLFYRYILTYKIFYLDAIALCCFTKSTGGYENVTYAWS